MSSISKKWLAGIMLSALLAGNTAVCQNPEQSPLTLTDVWNKAAVYNKQLQIQQLRVAGAQQQVKAAQDERLPEIKASGSYSRVSNLPMYEKGIFNAPTQFPVVHQSYSAGADAYLNVYNGGKTSREITVKQTESELAAEQRNMTNAEIKYKAAAYYLDIYRYRMYEKVMLQDIRDREKELEEIRQLLKNGVVLKCDVLRAELKLSQQKMTLLEIRNSLIIANQRLNIMIGQPDSINHHLALDTLAMAAMPEKDYNSYLAEAYEHAFAFKISEKETALSELRLKAVKSNILPKVGLFAEYSYAYPQILFYPYAISLYGLGQVGVKAGLPISALYQNRHKKEAAKIDLERQEIEHADTKDKVRQEVRAGYLRYTEALERIRVAQQNILQAQENFRIVNNTYFNQLSLLTDLLDAETQLLQSRFDLTNAEVTAQLQYYQLLKATGNL